MRAVLDTSVFVAGERRGIVRDPDIAGCVSVITIEELALGVALADDPDVRAIRSHTLLAIEDAVEVLDVDEPIARRCGALIAAQRRRGRRPKLPDALIAATALERELPVVTQDLDFLAFDGLDVILV